MDKRKGCGLIQKIGRYARDRIAPPDDDERQRGAERIVAYLAVSIDFIKRESKTLQSAPKAIKIPK